MRRKPNDHYQVKFPFRGETRFGIADMYSEQSKCAMREGQIIVEDAVLPVRYKVNLTDLTDLPMGEYQQVQNPETGMFEGRFTGEYNDYVHQQEKLAVEKSKRAGKGLKVGKLFTTGVGDGCAFYVVTKVNKKTCKVEWRSFQGDRWVDNWLGYGGTFPRDQIERQIGMEEGLDELFSR